MCRVSGAYADWLNFHQEHLHHVIPLMMAGLVNERLVSAASQALRDLTLECPVTITPFASPILDACQVRPVYSAFTGHFLSVDLEGS